jgi:hypothetical protein
VEWGSGVSLHGGNLRRSCPLAAFCEGVARRTAERIRARQRRCAIPRRLRMDRRFLGQSSAERAARGGVVRHRSERHRQQQGVPAFPPAAGFFFTPKFCARFSRRFAFELSARTTGAYAAELQAPQPRPGPRCQRGGSTGGPSSGVSAWSLPSWSASES